MSLDRLQSLKGMFNVLPETITSGTAQVEGGVSMGRLSGILSASQSYPSGGASWNVNPTIQSIGTGTTLFHFNCGTAIVSANALATGVILQPGQVANQKLEVVHIGGIQGILSMAPAITSNVADGVLSVIQPNRAVTFTWDANTSRWFRSGALS